MSCVKVIHDLQLPSGEVLRAVTVRDAERELAALRAGALRYAGTDKAQALRDDAAALAEWLQDAIDNADAIIRDLDAANVEEVTA